jgi:hypothetical protein
LRHDQHCLLLEDCPGLAALKDPFNNKAGLVSLIALARGNWAANADDAIA